MYKFKKEFENERVSISGYNQVVTKENLTDDLAKLILKLDPKFDKFEDVDDKEDVPAKV